MKEELAEGRFSADGSYVANTVDPLANHDTWLNGLSKVQIRQAKEAKERMDQKNREREKEESMRGEEQLTQLRDDCLIGLLTQVRQGETVAGALNRLGRNKKRVEQLSNDSSESSISRYTDKINRLTHFASTLLSSHGELEIYDQSYEDIIKTLKMEGAVRRDWVPPQDSLQDQELERKEEVEWKERERQEKEQKNRESGGVTKEGRSRVVISRPTTTSTSSKYWYKWNPAPQGQNPDEKYGPFERNELESWINQGYFGDNEASRILLRRDGDDHAEFKKWNEVR
jgi:CD2 antigen cytoplasmic tail-binding protein 2